MNRAAPSPMTWPLWVAAGMATANGLWLMTWHWAGGLPYDSTSGVWMTLADDFARGEFYRPVVDAAGYGGTRYMPLFFVLHGTLIKAGVAAAAAGMALTFVSLALFGAAAWRLMREFGATPSPAWMGVLLLPASIGLQMLGIAVKGDLLAAAFSAGGLAAAAAWRERGWRPGFGLACLGFAAAILTKFTAVFALGAMLLWLARGRRWREAGALAAGVLVCVAAGAGLAMVASNGRMLESFAACMAGGGALTHAWKFPIWFAGVAVQDPFFLMVFVAATALAVRRVRRRGFDLMACYFAVTAIGTMLLFVSPGIDSNHLADVLVASVVVLAVELAQGGTGRGFATGAAVFAAMIAATWLPGVISVRHFLGERGRPTQAAVAEIARRLPPGGTQRLLAENPVVPLALGQRPEMLDAFSLRLLAARDPALRARFFADLEAHRYTAVVLVDWSGTSEADLPVELARHGSPGVSRFYGDMHFPHGFIETLQRHYRLSFAVHPFVVFEPDHALADDDEGLKTRSPSVP
jgi:hypothetical protein